MAYHRRVDVLNETAAKGTYYDVNKAEELHVKHAITMHFFFKKTQKKMNFFKRYSNTSNQKYTK